MSADVRILLWYDYNVRKNKVSRKNRERGAAGSFCGKEMYEKD